MTATKTCSNCGHTKPATTDFFHRDRNRPDGYRPTCKRCRNPRVAELQRGYQAQPDVRAHKREYMQGYLEQPGKREKYRAYSREYMKDCSGKMEA